MTPLRQRLAWLFEDLHERQSGCENPWVLQRVRRLGGSGTIRLTGGTSLRFGRSQYPDVRKLVALASMGVAFRPRGQRHVGAEWAVSMDPPVVETPRGTTFALASVHPGIFAETFLHEIHFPGFDAAGRNVVDAGGFVGDTALYYASLGMRVSSYEPDGQNVALFRANLALNPELAPLISVYEEAVAEDGSVSFTQGGFGGGGIRGKTPSVRVVRSSGLRTILNRLDGPPFLLKADVKGAEFDIVRQPAIREFEKVQMEYATDYAPGRRVEDLIDGLKAAGFSRVRRFKHNWGNFSLDVHGMIHAEREP